MSLLRTSAAFVLLLAGLAVSGVLLLEHHGETGSVVSAASQLCGEGLDNGCSAVSSSPYSHLRGIPIAAIGVFFYVSLALLLVLSFAGSAETRSAGAVLSLLLVAAALVADVMLLGVQALVIGTFCNLCLVTYLINVVLLLLMLPARNSLRSLWSSPARTDGRQALAGWALGSLASIAAIVAMDTTLAYRAAQREANVLGTMALPLAPPSGEDAVAKAPAQPEGPEQEASEPKDAQSEAGAVPGTDGEDEVAPAGTVSQQELATARAESRRLQAILDDPEKLQRYLVDKATRDFEKSKVERIDLTNTPFRGPQEAPIRVVEYSDFLCPFCRSIAGALADFLPRSRNLVAVYYKNYPLDTECNPIVKRSVHEGGCQLALGAVCAQEQDGFWAFHDRAYRQPKPRPTVDDVVGYAAEAGLDFAALERCMGTEAARSKLSAQIEEGIRLGINATPTVYINGKRLRNINTFLEAVNSEAKRLGLEPLAPPPG
jgi:protein-disulfide isomerase/uncharacterized membrane protein